MGASGKARAPPQPLQNFLKGRLGGEPVFCDAPHRGKCSVKKFKPLVGTVDGDGGADRLEYLGVRVDVAPQLRLSGLAIGAITGETDCASCRAPHLADLDQPARAADDDWPP